MAAKKTQAKAEPKEEEVGTTIVRIRTQMKKQKIPITNPETGKVEVFSSQGFVLELDTSKRVQALLLDKLRKSRDYGSSYRELIPGSESTELANSAETLNKLNQMDKAAIWSEFQLHELEHFGLDQNSSADELKMAFLNLKKTI